MNKPDFITKVSEYTDMTKKDAEKFVNGMLDAIKDTLAHGDSVHLSGFGTFETYTRNERIGVNPQTGEKMKIDTSITPKFKAGKNLKQAVNS